MCKKTYLVLSGAIFLIVGLAHLARLIYHWPVQVAEWTVPMGLSWVGLPAAAILSIWAFSLLCGKCQAPPVGNAPETR